MMDLGLADRLRYWLTPAGFQVVEVDGWQTRGRTYAAYAPRGSVNHHTAGALPADAPSLGIVINGRSDLPGPLAQVFGSRSLVAYVVAAGVANHAGRGGWNGLAGNQTVGGLEIENCGTDAEPRTERQSDFAARVHCALITAPGSPADPSSSSQHFEWSTEGKIDFFQWPGDDLRARITKLLATGPGLAPPAAPVRPGLVQAKWFYKHKAIAGAADGSFLYGSPGDVPIVGDWNGDGADSPGVVRGNIFYLRNTLSSGVAEQVFAYGNVGDQPLVGHWKAGQRDSVGVRRGSTFYLRNPDTGVADTVFNYGDPGDKVVMGDWNGDGVDTPAVVRSGVFYARNSNTSGAADFTFGFGDAGDIALAGRWAKGATADGVLVAR